MAVTEGLPLYPIEGTDLGRFVCRETAERNERWEKERKSFKESSDLNDFEQHLMGTLDHGDEDNEKQ